MKTTGDVTVETIRSQDLTRVGIFGSKFTMELLKATTRARFKVIIDRLVSSGVQGVILGCTAIPMLVRQEDYAIPLYPGAFLKLRS